MAIGQGIYFNIYKDYSVDELERKLEDLQKYLSSDELKKARQEEIEKEIDDNNCIENVRTEISIIEELLKNKKATSFELNEKEKIRCPKCYSILKEYIYGKIKGEIDTNKYIAGGCILRADNPTYHCSKCNYDYDKNLNLMTETLEKLIESFIGDDPFWKDLLKEYFNKLTNISEDEKIEFLKKLSLNQHLFNDFTKEIVKPLDVKQIFEKYNRLLNNNEIVVEENPDIKLKKIVEEVIGNNDPYWNEPVYTVVKKIIELPNESEITIAKLLNYDPKEAFVEPLTQGQISNLIMEVCKKINIGLEEISDEFIGLAYNVQYKKVKLNLERELLGDIELKKIVEEVIGNNDPYWNEPVYTVVKKIIDLPDGTETTIIKLLNNSQYTSKQLFEIYNSVLNVCNKIDIILDSSKLKGRITGLPYSIPFIIKHN